jgi:hypothetical protein
MKTLSLWMVKDTATGLFKLQGDTWGKRGRVWTALSHIKLSLNDLAHSVMDGADEFALLEKYHFFGHGYVERECPEEVDAYKALMAQWKAKRNDTKTRYSYLPETWVVLRQQADGTWQKFCTCRDVHDKKE